MSEYPNPSGGYAASAQPQQTDGGATTSLILGIVGLVICGFFTGIPAIIVGSKSKKRIDASNGQLGGRGMAVAGVVLGWISVVLGVIALVLVIVVITVGSRTTTTFNQSCTRINGSSSAPC